MPKSGNTLAFLILAGVLCCGLFLHAHPVIGAFAVMAGIMTGAKPLFSRINRRLYFLLVASCLLASLLSTAGDGIETGLLVTAVGVAVGAGTSRILLMYARITLDNPEPARAPPRQKHVWREAPRPPDIPKDIFSGRTEQAQASQIPPREERTQRRQYHYHSPPPPPKPREAFVTEEQRHAQALGLNGRVNRIMIKSAFRTRIKQYHPDRFHNAPLKEQEQAEARTRDIMLAYAYFRQKYGGI